MSRLNREDAMIAKDAKGKDGFRRELGARVEDAAANVIGAAIEVHRQLGPGLSEDMYERALCIELAQRNIPYVCQHRVAVEYNGHVIGERRLDLIVDECLIIENKAIDAITKIEQAQALTYLRITRLSLCIIINYNVTTLRDGIKRVILSDSASHPSRSSRFSGFPE